MNEWKKKEKIDVHGDVYLILNHVNVDETKAKQFVDNFYFNKINIEETSDAHLLATAQNRLLSIDLMKRIIVWSFIVYFVQVFFFVLCDSFNSFKINEIK